MGTLMRAGLISTASDGTDLDASGTRAVSIGNGVPEEEQSCTCLLRVEYDRSVLTTHRTNLNRKMLRFDYPQTGRSCVSKMRKLPSNSVKSFVGGILRKALQGRGRVKSRWVSVRCVEIHTGGKVIRKMLRIDYPQSGTSCVSNWEKGWKSLLSPLPDGFCEKWRGEVRARRPRSQHQSIRSDSTTLRAGSGCRNTGSFKRKKRIFSTRDLPSVGFQSCHC